MDRIPEAVLVARRVEIEGVVQGVGFRPFIHRLATSLGLSGEVLNRTGGVTVRIEGSAEALDEFERRVRADAPPAAAIDRVASEDVEPSGGAEFTIVASLADGAGAIRVPPDIAICADCLREMRDPNDRRFGHPFINCTNCGPRFTIVRGAPYDRPMTSMAGFEMCPDCRREYEDIRDRRYHAQPVCCHACGPTLAFVRPGAEAPATPRGRTERAAASPEALRQAREALAAGRVVAVKGVGGFHLACDAGQEEAVARLRSRKRREEKPLAVMFRDLETAERHVLLSEEARAELLSPRAPIVLAPKRDGSELAPSVAPDAATHGALLPYTPVHHLLFEGAPYDALVMTSANLSEEPLCTENGEALERLAGIADAFLLHDRPILCACDDSVVRPTSVGTIVMRRARGYAPHPVRVGCDLGSVLAVGGHLKNTFCVTRGADAYVSQHIGDLSDAEGLVFFERQVEHLLRLLEARPEAIACDLHPGYVSTGWAEERAAEWGVPLVRVQHHHAHVAGVAAEHGVSGPVLGVACDGTGYGSDGTVWGCELLLAEGAHFRRVGRLRTAPLPGGDAAAREPWRMALVWAGLATGADPLQALPQLRRREADWRVLEAAIGAGLNAPLCSSAGRLFDAVAAMLGLCEVNAYEGQAPMKLEAAARESDLDLRWARPEPDGEGVLVLDPAPAIAGILECGARGTAVAELAGAFHSGFARALAEAAEILCSAEGLGTVALSGGTFQNERILSGVTRALETAGLRVLRPLAMPPGDGGLSLGQAAAAVWTRERS